jgi:hypothetical protein
MTLISSGIKWIGLLLLGNEDTIEELTFILLTNLTELADLGARLRKSSNIDTIEDEFVLDVLGLEDSAARGELDEMRFSTSEEVLDLKRLLILSNDSGNGEMCIYESHLVSETLSDTNDHVVDVRFDS